MKRIGFIGCGNMGGALASAVCRSVGGESVLLSDLSAEKADALAERLSASSVSLSDLLDNAECIFLGVKPQGFEALLSEIAPRLQGKLLISMAAGLSTERIASMLGFSPCLIRIMPNTPVAVGEGMILYTASASVTEEDTAFFLDILKEAGRLVSIDESRIDAASAVSGCGPAFAYLFTEALADAGVYCGLSRSDAQTFAAQMLLGSAKMVLESAASPGALKDAVCSPGGTTIAGVYELEKGGLRASVMNAVLAAYHRTLELK